MMYTRALNRQFGKLFKTSWRLRSEKKRNSKINKVFKTVFLHFKTDESV